MAVFVCFILKSNETLICDGCQSQLGEGDKVVLDLNWYREGPKIIKSIVQCVNQPVNRYDCYG